MRRLPIFFLLDVSESMIGDDLRSLESGVAEIVRNLRGDAHALETVHLAVIGFAGKAKMLTPLMDLVSFYPPRLPVGSGTSLGAGLTVLMNEIDRCVVRRSATVRGDYRPVVYLMTDGRPTDDVLPAIQRWKQHYAKRATLVAIAIGEQADLTVLHELTEHVMVFSQENSGDFAAIVRWVSMSISVQSQAVDSGTVSLAKPTQGLMELLQGDLARTRLDDSVVVLQGKCQKTKQPYLLKFKQVPTVPGMRVPGGLFGMVGSFAVGEEYQEWSDPGLLNPTINTDRLIGGAPCPHCSNRYAFATCACSGLHCVAGDGEARCPWCSKVGNYGCATDDQPGSEVSRGLG